MNEIKIHQTYSAKKLQSIFGSRWLYAVGLEPIPKITNKIKISVFNEFDDDTKQKYILIAKTIKNANPKQLIDVWAIGSRINGSWKTDKEAEYLAKKHNKIKPKYSDYDFTTTAKTIPNLKHLPFDCDSHQTTTTSTGVLIPRNLYF